MDFSNYIFRSHYMGDLVSVPKPLTDNQTETLLAYRERINGVGKQLTEKQKEDWHSLEYKLSESKKFSLTETAKNMCTNIVFHEKQGRNFKLETKYFDKGLETEKQGRDLISLVTGLKLTSDDERKTNSWVTGKRDIKHDDIIIDNKACFDFNTFNKHLLESKHEYYKRQLDNYMELWNINNSVIAYTLIDTPFKIINDEIRRKDWSKNILTIEGDVKDECIDEVVDLVQNHIYTRQGLEEFCQQSSNVRIEWFINFKEMKPVDRVHFVTHSFDKVRIEQRNECLRLCRDFMNTIKPMNNLHF